MGRASIASLRAAELSYSLRAAQQKLYGQGILLAYGQLGRACLRAKLLPMGRACRERAAQHHYNIVKCDIYIYIIYNIYINIYICIYRYNISTYIFDSK